MTSRCYFCGRTEEECKAFLDGFVKDNYAYFSSDPKYESEFAKLNEDAETQNREAESHRAALEEFEMKMNSPDHPQYQLAAKPSAFIEKYAEWTPEKYKVAVEIGFPFEGDDKEFLGSLFSKLESSDHTVKSAYDEMKKEYDGLRAAADAATTVKPADRDGYISGRIREEYAAGGLSDVEIRSYSRVEIPDMQAVEKYLKYNPQFRASVEAFIKTGEETSAVDRLVKEGLFVRRKACLTVPCCTICAEMFRK